MSKRQTWIKWVQSPECVARYGEPSAKVISAAVEMERAESALECALELNRKLAEAGIKP